MIILIVGFIRLIFCYITLKCIKPLMYNGYFFEVVKA